MLSIQKELEKGLTSLSPMKDLDKWGKGMPLRKSYTRPETGKKWKGRGGGCERPIWPGIVLRSRQKAPSCLTGSLLLGTPALPTLPPHLSSLFSTTKKVIKMSNHVCVYGIMYLISVVCIGSAGPVLVRFIDIDSAGRTSPSVIRLLPSPCRTGHDRFPQVRCIRPIDIHTAFVGGRRGPLKNGSFISISSFKLADFPCVSDHSACMKLSYILVP